MEVVSMASPTDVVERIDAEGFAEWYREREFARNIRNGQPYFNGPSQVPDPERHSPSQLMQCHRKIVYRQENAPEETEDPEGIFWAGRKFEEDVIVPYLQDAVVGDDTYVRNSMWVDETVGTEGQQSRFKGSTDPVIVTGESEPLVVTEVKTKDSLEHVSSPNRHHRAQVHAYMHGLSEKYDRDVSEAVVIYGSRTALDIKAFHESFDEGFWQEVCEWAAEHTAYRTDDVLPPGDPEYGWECEFCAFKHRCGESDEPYADVGPRGLLPGFTEYPRSQVKTYLESHDVAALTPVLAHEYPELAEEFAVQQWECPGCETMYAWDDVDQRNDSSTRPFCPSCADDGDLVTLQVGTSQEMKGSSGEGGEKVDFS